MSEIYKVTTLNDSNCGSLREGIIYANCHPNTQIIFEINGEILLYSSLPKITNTMQIIGNITQEGKPLNIINGNREHKLFHIDTTNNCVIKNVCLINSICYGILLNKSLSNQIYNCWIGINTNNEIKRNKYGIILYNSTKNIIGSNPDSKQEYFSNVISGNKKSGIYVIHSQNNIIQNNIIGLSSKCDEKLPNSFGIYLQYSENNIIGGKKFIDNNGNINNPTGDKGTVTAVFVRPLDGNIISGNTNDGIKFISSIKNNILGNFIGTGCDGLLNFGNGKNGIYFENSDFNSITGCGVDSNPFIYYNVVGWNKHNGIQIHNSNFTTIQGNFLGIGSNNDNAVPNLNGLKISGNCNGTALGGIIPLGNVISGNTTNGIHLTDNISGFDSVNTFCGIKAFGDALPNNRDGILIDENAKNIKLNTNVISGNNGNGINIKGNAKSILIVNNIIGLNTGGSVPLPNVLNGIKISENASGITDTFDVPSVIAQNTISSNLEYGILIDDKAHTINFLFSNIGLAINTSDFVSNLKGGIFITGKVHNCKFGDSLKFLYVYDRNNFAIKFDKHTYNIVATYCFINTNNTLDSSVHNKNIVDLSDKNYVYGNALPVI
jgi:parallel beta-helix repeat protein